MDNELNMNDINENASTINFADIIVETVKDFKKIKSDVNRLSDRKIERFCRDYNIRAGEKIIAYYKKSILGMFLGGGIFTDKAFYCKPEEIIYINYKNVKKTVSALSDKDENDIIRIDYMDLCHYVVTRQSVDSSSSAGLCNETTFIAITKHTFLENILASEVYTVFVNLQNNLITNSDEADVTINEFMSYHYNLAIEEMKSGICSMGREMILRSFVKIGVSPKKALTLLAENAYRKCDLSEYKDLLKEFEEYMSDTFKRNLEGMTDIFANKLINELSDFENEFSDDYLEGVCNHLKYKDTSKEMTSVLIYVCIRMNMHDFARKRISAYEQAYGKDDRVNEMESCVCIDGHKKMKEVIDALSANQDIPKKYYHIVDSIGFTPLHYAMILERKEAMKQLIESGEFYGVLHILPNDINKLFSYIVFAKLTHTNYSSENYSSDIDDWVWLITCIKSEMNESVPSLAELTEPKVMKLYKKIKKLYIACEKAAIRCANEKEYEKIKERDEELSEIKEEIYDKTAEISEQCEALRKKRNEDIKELSESDVPIIQFFFNTLKNNKRKFIDIYNQVDSSDKCKLYNYNGFLIMMPDCAEFEFTLQYRVINMQEAQSSEQHRENQSSTDYREYDFYEKKYATSWFSNEAHFDKEILKAEYRILVKKYHPDAAKNSVPESVFIEIHNEYEEILNQL